MLIQHKVVDSTFQTSSKAFIEEEAGTGNFSTTFPVKNAEVFTKIPVSFWFEVKLARSSPTSNFYVIVFVSTDRNTISRDVGKSCGKFCQFRIDFSQFSIKSFYLSRESLHGSNFIVCILFVAFSLSNLSRNCITFCFKCFNLDQDITTFCIDFFHLVQDSSIYTTCSRWSGRATVPSNFTGVHLIMYLVCNNGRISPKFSICSQRPQTF